MENLMDIIFTPKCAFCGRLGKNICTDCLLLCNRQKHQKCIVCDKISSYGYTHEYCAYIEKRIREEPRRYQPRRTSHKILPTSIHPPTQLLSCYEYAGLVRKGITKAKYGRKKFVILKTLSQRGILDIVSQYHDIASLSTNSILVPIPSSRSNMKVRGFNQAEVVAKEFCKVLGLPLKTNLLKRKLDTKRQHSKTREDRIKNVSNAFAVSANLARNKEILLVDDICTTGATLLAASTTLYAAGVKEVRCLVLSKVL
jgi:ComF family protein